MGIYVNPNNDGLKQSLNSKIYVDKSGMIEVTNSLLDTRQNCMCISRPRRFGKFMNIDLLIAYYSKGCDSKDLFANLKIAKNPDFEKHLNKYNVIALNLPQLTKDPDDGQQIIDNFNKLVVQDLKKEYPDIVKYVENPPILTSKFCDYIGYGSEPSIEENEKKYSFNQLREKIINNAFDITIDNWIEDNIDKGISYNDKQISTIDLISEVCADQIYGYYKDLFIRYKLNNQLNLFRTNYGLTSLDFESSELRLRIYERIKKHVKDIVSDPSYISTHEDELSIEVHDGKVISITDSKFLSAKKGIVRFIFNDDHTLMQELKNNINKLAKFEGVDTFNFAFDDRIKSKFELQDKYLRRRQKLEKEDQIYETKQLSA